MKLIVVGASGLIGKAIMNVAREKGIEAIGTRYVSCNDDLIQFDLIHSRLIDVLPSGFVNSKCPTFAVICSAESKIDKCFLNKEYSYKLNVTKTIELLKELNSIDIKFIFLSSDFVFDGINGYYDEGIEPSPKTEYGKQKAEVERYISSYMPDSLIFRLSKIVSDNPLEGHFFSEIYKKLVENKPIECIEGQIFSPTYVNDVSRSALLALEMNLKGLYHVSNTEFFSREELTKQLMIILNRHNSITVKPLDHFPFQDTRSLKTYLDGSKFIKDTGISFTSMKYVMKRFAENVKNIL